MDPEDKTLPATPKRRGEQRKKGNVPRSQEVSAAASLIVSIILFFVIAGRLGKGIMNITHFFLEQSSAIEVRAETVGWILSFALDQVRGFMVPLFITLVIVGLVSSVIVGGLNFSTEAMAPKWSSLNPIQGVKKLFSAQAIFTLGKSILKLAIIGGITFVFIKNKVPCLIPLVGVDAGVQGILIGKALFQLALTIALVFIITAVIDGIFQSWQYEKGIRMSPQEQKEETRQTLGAPEIKSRIRGEQIRLMRQRMGMLPKVKEATVVVTNPTRLAIALKYETRVQSSVRLRRIRVQSNEMRAPMVVAKGGGVIAKKIIEIARKYGVPIVEDKEVARLLFQHAEIGKVIPGSLFIAVARILAYVYKQKGRIS